MPRTARMRQRSGASGLALVEGSWVDIPETVMPPLCLATPGCVRWPEAGTDPVPAVC